MDAIKFLKQLVEEIDKMEKCRQANTEKTEKSAIHLTEQQKIAIKGRIAEGHKWGARNKDESLVFFCAEEPEKCKSYDYLLTIGGYSFSLSCEFYNFITSENSPIYLPDLLGGDE